MAERKPIIKPLNDEELSRAYSRQKKFTYTTSGLGLTGLGLLGASVATKKLPANAARNVHMNAERSEKIRRVGQNVGITAGGIGGLAGINWARIADAESRRTIRKSNYGVGYSQYYRENEGDVGVAVGSTKRPDPRKLPFTTSRKAADPERSRRRRAAVYPYALGAGAGGTGALTVAAAVKKTPNDVKKSPYLDQRLLRSKPAKVAAGTAATGGLAYGAFYNAKKKNRASYDSWYPQYERD